MTYTVTLEHGSDGNYLAWVHELPGCFARGSSRADVEAQLPEAIRAFLAWLHGAGETVEDEDIAVEIADEVESVIDPSEDTEVLLSAHASPRGARERRGHTGGMGRSAATQTWTARKAARRLICMSSST